MSSFDIIIKLYLKYNLRSNSRIKLTKRKIQHVFINNILYYITYSLPTFIRTTPSIPNFENLLNTHVCNPTH